MTESGQERAERLKRRVFGEDDGERLNVSLIAEHAGCVRSTVYNVLNGKSAEPRTLDAIEDAIGRVERGEPIPDDAIEADHPEDHDIVAEPLIGDATRVHEVELNGAFGFQRVVVRAPDSDSLEEDLRRTLRGIRDVLGGTET